MKLSEESTIIAPEKLYEYILNPFHPDGKSKAQFLQEIGYDQAHWQLLEKDLREQHLSIEADRGKESNYGQKYEIVAPLAGPNGKEHRIRSIWMIRHGENFARFITLIPEEKI